MKNEIKNAILTSITESRVVRVTTQDSFATYTEVSAQCDDCDSAETEPGELDVWGTLDGELFRLRIAI
jgi:hypothetical protein